jgi:acyl-CoA synthetase (AMP-forming)/AMP-acid ligase II
VVVVALGDATSSPTLACAYVSRSGASVDDVRARATRQLSSHMIPSVIRKIAALPLLNNGKTDRKQVERLLSSDGKL